MLLDNRRLVSAVMFFPRGGSAHAARSFCGGLQAAGWEVSLVAGSRSDAGPEENAIEFYAGIDTHPVDFAAALASEDPIRYVGGAGEGPMHPSFEDRPGVPDKVFSSLADDVFEVQVEAWTRALAAVDAAGADVLYLHHLTPLNEAASRCAPGVPVVGQLHGTELLMLEEIRADPGGRPHSAAWAERLASWADRCEALVVPNPAGARRAVDLLGVDRSCLAVVPNPVNVHTFRPREIDAAAHWRRHLVEDPQGWLPGEGPGSVRYSEAEIAPLISGPVLLYVGRFTEVKRVPLLIRAFARAQRALDSELSLVLLGGHPGEWEGEHPIDAIDASGAENVFLCGWHPQSALPDFANASSAVVLPSVREQFGQALVEAMACGLPAIAVDSLGPASIIDEGRTGWLVAPDDEDALRTAICEAFSDRRRLRAHGLAARHEAVARFSSEAAISALGEVLSDAVDQPRPRWTSPALNST